jgi:pimeloyl-ACP methyl ester carboxylesterase
MKKKMVLNMRYLSRKVVFAVLLLGVLILSGCATPVGVSYLSPQDSHRKLTANVLTGSALSAPTMQMLNRTGLAERFKTHPAEVIAAIHKGVPTADETDRIFALAELSFLYASQSGDRSYYLASAVYAWALLFPEGGARAPDAFDPRFRTAVDIYNLGIAEGFTSADGVVIDLKEGTYKLPFGEVAISVRADSFRWSSYRLVRFADASKLSVRGLRNEYRWPGIGAALVASTEYLPGAADPVTAKVPFDIKVAVTLLVRFHNVDEGIRTGRMRGRLELYTTDSATAVTVGGRTVPLEFDLSSALAYSLENSGVYRLETKGFFSGNVTLFKDASRFKENIFFMSPYIPGRIPVIFIHGTASSPARWAEMLNELQNDRRLWGRYQFWAFTYNTGNPILYSGGLLTKGLRELIDGLDPEGRDPALRKMVVVGHSQGGLLTRLTVVDSGTHFWDDAAKIPFDKLDVSSGTRELIRRSFFYKPLPFVSRVIFISTPHRGSYVAGGWIGKMAGRFVSLPFRMLDAVKEVTSLNPQVIDRSTFKGVPKSTANMDPNSQFVRTFSSIPIVPGISVHSIISVENPDAPKDKWTDGVVKYGSAHLDNAASELIVHSDHSCQSQPQTIEEVRRILLLHIGIQ